MKKLEFTDEIKNKVLDLIADEWLPEDYDYNVVAKYEDDYILAVVISDGIQVWVINQNGDNEQNLSTFMIEGDKMVCANFPMEIMEVSNTLRNLNASGKLGFVWDYMQEGE